MEANLAPFISLFKCFVTFYTDSFAFAAASVNLPRIMEILLISVGVVLVFSFLCSLMESMLLSLNPVRLEAAAAQGKLWAKMWTGMKSNIDRPIAAILILNTVANTGGATFAGGAFDSVFGKENLWIFSIGLTIMILVGTEIIPKVIGVTYAERLAPIFGPILRTLIFILRPIILITEFISRPFKKGRGNQGMSIADLTTMTRMAHSGAVISSAQQSIILNAASLRNKTVRDIMIPLDAITYFSLNKSNIENFELAATTLHTRYPVSKDGSVQNIMGYLNYKELVAMSPSRKEAVITNFVRPIPRVSGDAKIEEALKVLTTKRNHLAMVEAPGGDVIGMVTLEDIIETVIGEFGSEFDHLPNEILQVAPDKWKIGGGTLIKDMYQKTKFSPKTPDFNIPVDQWIRDKSKKPVQSGFSFEENGFTVTVLQIRRGEIYRILLAQNVLNEAP